MAIWGGSFVASNFGLNDMYPVELATLRFAIATPLLVVLTIALSGWKSLLIDRKDLPVLFGMAMTGITLQYIVQLIAMTYTTVTNTVLLINMGTFFVIILSAHFLKEKFSIFNIAGVVLAFLGAAIIITNGQLSLTSNVVGDGLVLISALFWAVYVMIGNKLAGKYSILTQLNWIFIIGFLGLLPVYAITSRHDLASLPAAAWGSLLYLALFCSIVAYFFFNDAIVKIGPSQTAIYQYFEPMFGILLAIALIGEPLTGFIIAGAILIVAGIALADNNLKIVDYFLKPGTQGPASKPRS
jgi:drug/metabolite transporter (DMT)-like permease